MRKLLRGKDRLAFDALPLELDEHTRNRFFTLSPPALKLIATKRGDHNKLGFALHGCWLPLLGWQPDNFERTPTDTVAFVAQQLALDPAVLANYPRDAVTWWDHAAEARRALRWRKYGARERKGLIAEAQRVALQHDDSQGLLQAAVEWCRRERVVRPGLTTLEADISVATAQAERQLHQWVHHAPPKKTRQSFWARIDRLVEPGPKGKSERLAYFKEPPGQPTADNLLAICDRIHQLTAYGLADLDLSKINPNRRKWLANEAMRKSPSQLREQKPFKRHAALGCLLADILKSSYDYAAEMHERLMAESRARAEAKRQTAFAEQREKFLRCARNLGHCCEIVADPVLTPKQKIDTIHRYLGNDEQLRALAAECAELTHPDLDSRVAFLRNKISYVNRFAPTFIQTMNFAAVKSSAEAQAVLAGIEHIRAVYAGDKAFSDQPPIAFLTHKLKSEIVKAEGQVEQALWEIALN